VHSRRSSYLFTAHISDLFFSSCSLQPSGTPTFSQVASNAVWSGWKDEAFPTFEAAATSQAKKGGNGGKDKKKVVLFSTAGSRRY
jgi:hypothetical protein